MRSGSLHQKNYEAQISINSMLKDEIEKKIKRMRAKYNIKNKMKWREMKLKSNFNKGNNIKNK
jgi:hypothetical protein